MAINSTDKKKIDGAHDTRLLDYAAASRDKILKSKTTSTSDKYIAEVMYAIVAELHRRLRAEKHKRMRRGDDD